MASSDFFLFSLLLLPLLLLLKLIAFKSKYRLPPGPRTLPIIGSIHHLAGRGFRHHALHALSKRYGHIMYVQLGQLKTVVVSSKEAAREISKTHDLKFCNHPVNPIAKVLTYETRDIILAPYGNYWREMRKLCVLELLSPKRVQSFRSIREDEVQGLIQWIRSTSSTTDVFNLSERLFNLTNDITYRSILGTKTKQQELYFKKMKKFLELLEDFGVVNLFPSSWLVQKLTGNVRRAEVYRSIMDQIFENILREQKEQGEGDVENLLSVLLRLLKEGSRSNILGMENIKAVVFNIVGAGTGTSATIIDWAMANLVRNPRVMKKAQTEVRQHFQSQDNVSEGTLKELHYMQAVIKETLRLHPPLPLLLPKECQETCNILGHDIPKGTLVTLNAWALGRDPNYWKDAEEFKPERFQEESSEMNFTGDDFEFIPFGTGRRICPGITFASAIIELVLANLLFHFDWELPNGIKPHELDMTEATGVLATKRSPLLLRATPNKY